MLKFEDFFNIKNPEKTKVKFNMNAGNVNFPAWDFLSNGEEDINWIGMNSHRSKKSRSNDLDKAEYLLAFAQYYPYGPEYYIFGGMYKVEKIIPEVDEGIGYKLTLLPDFEDYRKRLIIRLSKPIGRNNYNRWYNSVQEGLNPEIYEIAPSTKLGAFPGYSNFRLSHRDLQEIFKRNEPQWRNALSNVKGVYCITDTSTGQLYIGSASGDSEGIWRRWAEYANVSNLTGGNKVFEELKKSGADYIIDNFSYSILEIFDMRTKREDIVYREEYWKKVFKTVKFGMNR